MGELEDIAIDLMEKYKGLKLDRLMLSAADTYDDIFLLGGALDVLRENKGGKYIHQLAGVRKPRNIRERFVYYLIGRLPSYQE